MEITLDTFNDRTPVHIKVFGQCLLRIPFFITFSISFVQPLCIGHILLVSLFLICDVSLEAVSPHLSRELHDPLFLQRPVALADFWLPLFLLRNIRTYLLGLCELPATRAF